MRFNGAKIPRCLSLKEGLAVSAQNNWTPAKFGSNLVLWLNADDLVGSAGTSIYSWTDRSSSHANAAQANGSFTPIIGSLSTGVKAAAVSDGSRWMSVAANILGSAQAATMVTVYQWTSTTTAYRGIAYIGNAGAGKGMGLVGDSGGKTNVSNYSTSIPLWNEVANTPDAIIGSQDQVGSVVWRVGNGAATNQNINAPYVNYKFQYPAGSPSGILTIEYNGTPVFGAVAKLREIIVLNKRVTQAEADKLAKYIKSNSGV